MKCMLVASWILYLYNFFLGKARIEMDILQSMPNFSQFLQVLRTFVDGGTVVDIGGFSVSAVSGSFTPEEQLGN